MNVHERSAFAKASALDTSYPLLSNQSTTSGGVCSGVKVGLTWVSSVFLGIGSLDVRDTDVFRCEVFHDPPVLETNIDLHSFEE